MTTRASSDVAFTPAVKAAQERLGSRRGYASMEERGGWPTTVTEELAEFLAERDSVYLATATADGQPYVQHRGGAPGFVKVVDEHTLAFADFSGNRQYVSLGNLSENDRAFLFVMDYRNRRRIKIWGRAEFVEGDQKLLEGLVDPDYRGRPERALVFHVEAWDVNCPQHIPVQFSAAEVSAREKALQDRIVELQRENDALRADRDVTEAS